MQMERNKRFIAVLIIVCLAVLLAVAAQADVKPLEIEMTVHGQPLREDGWVEPGVEYRDESIHAVLTTERYQNVHP